MSYEITLNWNITTYEVTATGGREAPTIITSYIEIEIEIEIEILDIRILCI